ncbi:MAG: polysaccharide deacetylase family protein [Candidatus Sumerlaeaceae bacterium]|nr:polysaccharide deacetylase family protein [Candidatus Sumerlaeaceae bacterium]
MTELKIAALAAAFVLIFFVAYAAFQRIPIIAAKLGSQTATFIPPKEVLTAKSEKPEETLGGRGATRDLSKIVEAYRQHDQLGKMASPGLADSTTSGEASTVKHAAAVRTPPPTLKIIREWPTGKKRLALTFDDGPHPELTRRFLALLAEKGVKATFFLLGPNVEKNPDIVKEIVAAGHEVGNHSWNHPVLNKLTPERIREELEKTSQAIANASGAQVRLVRPPYGSVNKKVEDICDSLGTKIICWSIDTEDWRKNTTKDKMVETVKKNVRDGAIILMHDRFEKSYETTAEIIDALRADGYEFVTVGELLGLGPQQVAAAAPAASASRDMAKDASGQAVAAVSVPAPPPTQLDVPAAVAQSTSTSSTAALDVPAVSPEKITRPPLPAPSRQE